MGFSFQIGGRGRRPETRERMIRETEAWLTWALRQKNMPRIPTRRVSAGGFSDLVRRPMGRLIATHWWARTMDAVSRRDGEPGMK